MKKYEVVLDRCAVTATEVTKFGDAFLKETIECDKVETTSMGGLFFEKEGKLVALFSQDSWLYFKLVE